MDVITIRSARFDRPDSLLAGMFEDRKRLFVDLFGWDVPVVDGRYEIDQFDGAAATYLIALGETTRHIGSLRLLPTTAPHILGDLFPELCDTDVPRGPAVREITRLCLPTRLGATMRRVVRDRLISAMVDHALGHGIATLTGVVASSFLAQILAMGWRCAALGPARMIGSARLGAFRIDLDEATPDRLAAHDIYRPGALAAPDLQQAA